MKILLKFIEKFMFENAIKAKIWEICFVFPCAWNIKRTMCRLRGSRQVRIRHIHRELWRPLFSGPGIHRHAGKSSACWSGEDNVWNYRELCSGEQSVELKIEYPIQGKRQKKRPYCIYGSWPRALQYITIYYNQLQLITYLLQTNLKPISYNFSQFITISCNLLQIYYNLLQFITVYYSLL